MPKSKTIRQSEIANVLEKIRAMATNSVFENVVQEAAIGKGALNNVFAASFPNLKTHPPLIIRKFKPERSLKDQRSELKALQLLDESKPSTHLLGPMFHSALPEKLDSKSARKFTSVSMRASEDLFSYQENQSSPLPLSEVLIKSWVYQLLCAVKSLHDQELVHRDIKLENILLLHYFIYLTDFGSLRKVNKDGTCKDKEKLAIGTTLDYLPPAIATPLTLILSKEKEGEEWDTLVQKANELFYSQDWYCLDRYALSLVIEEMMCVFTARANKAICTNDSAKEPRYRLSLTKTKPKKPEKRILYLYLDDKNDVPTFSIITLKNQLKTFTFSDSQNKSLGEQHYQAIITALKQGQEKLPPATEAAVFALTSEVGYHQQIENAPGYLTALANDYIISPLRKTTDFRWEEVLPSAKPNNMDAKQNEKPIPKNVNLFWGETEEEQAQFVEEQEKQKPKSIQLGDYSLTNFGLPYENNYVCFVHENLQAAIELAEDIDNALMFIRETPPCNENFAEDKDEKLPLQDYDIKELEKEENQEKYAVDKAIALISILKKQAYLSNLMASKDNHDHSASLDKIIHAVDSEINALPFSEESINLSKKIISILYHEPQAEKQNSDSILNLLTCRQKLKDLKENNIDNIVRAIDMHMPIIVAKNTSSTLDALMEKYKEDYLMSSMVSVRLQGHGHFFSKRKTLSDYIKHNLLTTPQGKKKAVDVINALLNYLPNKTPENANHLCEALKEKRGCFSTTGARFIPLIEADLKISMLYTAPDAKTP